MKILMLVAHPDDEVVFGASDLLSNTNTNEITVVCFTCGNNRIRRKEFEECMRLTNAKGYMLSLHDSIRDNWYQYSNSVLGDMAYRLLAEQSFCFDMIVSHGEDGEYGHIQHKRVHNVAKELSQRLSCPFATFRERYNPENMKNRDEIMKVYKSQARIISRFKDLFIESSAASNSRR